MKKNSIYALMSAIALAGAVGFSSCSSTEDEANVNPGYDAVKGEVPVQFLFNVGSYGGAASTRQTADATQATNNLKAEKFRGIEGAHILCFHQASNGQYVSSSTNGDAHVVATKDFNMARVAQPGTLGYNEAGDNSNTTRVLEMTFPLETNSMIFYGKAITDESSNYKNIYGHLDSYYGSEDLTSISFTLGRRLTSDDKEQFHQIQKLLAAILTCVMETNRGTSTVNANDEPEEGADKYGWDIPQLTGFKWVNYYLNYMNPSQEDGKRKSPVDESTNMTELELKLATAYKEMTTIQTAELRNGSGPALTATIKELWGIVNSVRCAQPTDQCEAVAKYMAQRIHTELERYFEPTFGETAKTEGGAPTKVTIKNRSEVLVPMIISDNFWPGGSALTENDFNAITINDLNTFPATFNIPQGSTHLKFNRYSGGEEDAYMPEGTPVNAFYYVQNYNSSAAGGGEFTVDDYYYPSELLYFGNSPIRVSDEEHEVLQYPQTTTKWTTENSEEPVATDPWYGWTANGSVNSHTRSVAMTNNINYGTALLEMTIGYNSDIIDGTKKLLDNNHAIQERDYSTNEPDLEVPYNGTSFKLVGVLVGGQSPRIGWNMLPALQGDERQGYIFDNQLTNNGIIPATGNSQPNYTMVFDNYNANLADDAQDKVYIALELQNNTGMDFFGKDNLIANGSNFYLIGKLDPTNKTAPDLPAYHALPPYKDGLNGKTVPRVFIQDHKTTVNFKIGENSLKYAYLTVPDLRSSSVTLGLSVDMSWSAGLSFDDVTLGGSE